MASPQTALRGRLDGSGHGSPKHWALGPALPAPGRSSRLHALPDRARTSSNSPDQPGIRQRTSPCPPSCAPGIRVIPVGAWPLVVAPAGHPGPGILGQSDPGDRPPQNTGVLVLGLAP